MPDKASFLKAIYCRAVLKTALHSPEADARRLVYCLVTEAPTPNVSPEIGAAERGALEALAILARRIEERGAAAIATHWKETNDMIEIWVKAAYQANVY
jgi:hypothetical protein